VGGLLLGFARQIERAAEGGHGSTRYPPYFAYRGDRYDLSINIVYRQKKVGILNDQAIFDKINSDNIKITLM
jgi:hypothetical protein